MTGDASMLVAFVKAASTWEPGLARWTAAAVWRGLPARRRQRLRDDLLRLAARALGPESLWRKANFISGLTRRRRALPDTETAEGLTALAMAFYPGRSLSVAAVFRALSLPCRSPVEVKFGPARESMATEPLTTIFPGGA